MFMFLFKSMFIYIGQASQGWMPSIGGKAFYVLLSLLLGTPLSLLNIFFSLLVLLFTMQNFFFLFPSSYPPHPHTFLFSPISRSVLRETEKRGGDGEELELCSFISSHSTLAQAFSGFSFLGI
jgi:hypothetical protein